MKYIYSFFVWPDEEPEFDRAVFRLFKFLNHGGRCEMEFTELDFTLFRQGLADSGFTLREIERIAYVEPESVL